MIFWYMILWNYLLLAVDFKIYLIPRQSEYYCTLYEKDRYKIIILLYAVFFNRPTAEVTFHFFGNSDDGDKIRESLNRLVQRRRLSEISLESTHFTFQQKPALKLQVRMYVT